MLSKPRTAKVDLLSILASIVKVAQWIYNSPFENNENMEGKISNQTHLLFFRIEGLGSENGSKIDRLILLMKYENFLNRIKCEISIFSQSENLQKNTETITSYFNGFSAILKIIELAKNWKKMEKKTFAFVFLSKVCKKAPIMN